MRLQWDEPPESTPEARIWRLIGPIDRRQGAFFRTLLSAPFPPPSGTLTLRLDAVTAFDGSGAAFLTDLWRKAQTHGFTLRLEGVPAHVKEVLELYRPDPNPPPPRPLPGFFEGVGALTYEGLRAGFELMVLASDITWEALGRIIRPWTLRRAALIEQSVLMGSQALGIVGLIMFLVGLTLAFQTAFQLRQFGASVWVAKLTSVSTVREMGPLITAILVAGRSGASITSEVATMKVNEEIDALQVMGISFVDFVAVPRLIALVVMLPLLTIVADLLGILGGYVVSTLYLDLGSLTYWKETLDALSPRDLSTGLIKSMSFAWGIALIGLFFGSRVRGGAQDVGRATTSSVVMAIFYIIIADSVFSIFFYVIL